MSLQEKILKRKLKKKEKQKLKVIEGRKTAKLEEDEDSVELENIDENEPTGGVKRKFEESEAATEDSENPETNAVPVEKKKKKKKKASGKWSIEPR